MKVIAVAGRKGSGKSVLAKICTEQNYRVLKFADGLKDIVAEIFSITRDELEERKEVLFDNPLVFNRFDYNIFIRHTGFYNHVVLTELLLGREFTSIRHMLQYLGTDVIRLINPNWHIEKLRSKMKIDGKYIIDDLRFMNEYEFCQSIHSQLIRITRPGLDTSDVHSSETSLEHMDFPTEIINDGTLDELTFKFTKWIERL